MRSIRPLVAGAVTLVVGLSAVLFGAVGSAAPAEAANASYVPISGAGSTWAANALDQWRRNVEQYGIRVNYAATGSSDGRNQFKAGTVDFGASEIPYGVTDNGVTEQPPSRGYAYIPDVAGGTAFMYNLTVGGKRITDLRLSGETLTKIFTGVITKWNDAEIAKENPGLDLPDYKIVPVVRSDGSGSTAQLTLWMNTMYRSLWDSYCTKVGRKVTASGGCGETSIYPINFGSGFVAQNGDTGVSGYVAQTANVGSITYVEYSYALQSGFPVASMLNQAGFYVQPNAQNVAVALLKAQINTDKSSSTYLTQKLDQVYVDPDPRAYPLSSYSYLIIPTATQDGFTTAKGQTLAAFTDYLLCEGQQQAPVLGYSPLPINLVQAGFNQVRKIPGAVVKDVNIKTCNNPTFSTNGTNTLAVTAPYPDVCQKQGSAAGCVYGTLVNAQGKPTSGTTSTKRGGGTAPTTGSGTTKTGTTAPATGGGGGGGTTGDPGTGTGEPQGGNSTGGSGGGAVQVINANGTESCDPDTGQCQVVAAVPVTAPSSAFSGLPRLFVILSAIAVLLLIIAPPVVVLTTRRSRR